MDLGIKGRAALVLAASKGLGKAVSLALSSEGVRVLMCAREEASLRGAAEEVSQSTGSEVFWEAGDVGIREDLQRVTARAIDLMGGVDILVTNVGPPPSGAFNEIDDDQWLATFERVHLSAVRAIREVLPHMREQRWGRIIGIQSSSVKQPIEGLILSNGVRPAVAGLFKSLAAEVGPDNVTVNLALPGIVSTGHILSRQGALAVKNGRSLEEQLAVAANNLLLKRLGTPEEFGNVVAFLSSERAAFITGAVIQVDGGMIRSVV